MLTVTNPPPNRYRHDSQGAPRLPHSSHMMLPVEIVTCLAAIAGAAKLAAIELTRLRKERQMAQALARAFSA